MVKKFKNILTSIPATVLGGIFLVLSIVCSKCSIAVPADPAWVTVIICGLPLLYNALRKLVCNHGISKISSALLISIAMAAAIAIGDLFAAGEVAFIMAIGEILEDLTTNRAKKGLKKLISLAPTQGRKLVHGTEYMISAAEIQKGDMLRILPGETIPVDGIILTGETSVDQSVLTGESMPVDKTVPVYGTGLSFGALCDAIPFLPYSRLFQRPVSALPLSKTRLPALFYTITGKAVFLHLLQGVSVSQKKHRFS